MSWHTYRAEMKPGQGHKLRPATWLDPQVHDLPTIHEPCILLGTILGLTDWPVAWPVAENHRPDNRWPSFDSVTEINGGGCKRAHARVLHHLTKSAKSPQGFVWTAVGSALARSAVSRSCICLMRRNRSSQFDAYGFSGFTFWRTWIIDASCTRKHHITSLQQHRRRLWVWNIGQSSKGKGIYTWYSATL